MNHSRTPRVFSFLGNKREPWERVGFSHKQVNYNSGQEKDKFPTIVLAKSFSFFLFVLQRDGQKHRGGKKTTLRLLGFFPHPPEKRKRRNDVIFAYSEDASRSSVFKLRKKKDKEVKTLTRPNKRNDDGGQKKSPLIQR